VNDLCGGGDAGCRYHYCAGLRWVLLMLQHWAHPRNRPTAMNEKKISILYFGCDFSGWYYCGKIIKIVVTSG